MPYDLTEPLVIGISSRALFNLEEENRIYENEGLAAYEEYQVKHESDILQKGSAFQLVKAFLQLNKLQEKRLVEVIVMSRNSPNTSLRIFNSIQDYELDITRAALTGGSEIAPYLRAFKTDLFLSAFHEGFAHLLSYQATEIDCVDLHTPQLTEVAAASRAKLRLALTETDPDRQKQFLEEAVCGSYYEKFACMCGMLYLADRWETQGIDGLQSAFADYHGFAQRALSIRI